MTTGAEGDSERFAAALEHGLRAGSVSPGDDELLRELELVALLRQSRASLAPSADASARMRARVMGAAAGMMPAPTADPAARTEVVATETAAPETAVLETGPAADEATNVVPIGAARGRHRFPARLRAGEGTGRRGALGISAAAALMVLAVTGGGALFSQGALPGDTLYGVKQASESGMIALTPGQGNKAQRQLDYAATRLNEVDALSSNRTASADRGRDISDALHGFNDQATAGSRMWLAGGSGSSELASWASTQSKRLTAMRSSMPTSSQGDADESLRMLEQMRSRANALSNRKGCDTVTTGQTDQFGPVPSKESCLTQGASNPAVKQVVPGTPTKERTSLPSSAATESSRSSQLPSTRQDTTTGNSPSLELPELPGRESTTGGDSVVPKAPADNEQPSTGFGGVLKGLLGG